MTTWLVRTTGNNNNGGTSATVRSTGTDGVTNGTNTLTSASASWTAADIGHGIFIGGVNVWRLITAVASGTSLTFSGATIAAGSGRTWTVGGSFQTIAKAVGSTFPVADGDSVYIGAGIYRETPGGNWPGITPSTSFTIAGDADGSHTGDPGETVLTAYTTNDTTAPSSTAFTAGIRSNTTIKQMTFVFAGGAAMAASGVATGVTWQDCTFIHGANNPMQAIAITVGAGATPAHLIDRCRFYLYRGTSTVAGAIGVTITVNRHTSDYNTGIVIQNCYFDYGGNDQTLNSAILVTATGAGSFCGGGVAVKNCTFRGNSYAMRTDNLIPTSIPCTFQNSYVRSSGGINANTAGQITEDHNAFDCSGTVRTNVTAGTGSVTVMAPHVSVGQEANLGMEVPALITPMATSALMAFTTANTPPAYDLLNRLRPSGGASPSVAAGALERHDVGAKETSTVRTGSNAMKFTGPGDQDFDLPVDATSTTVTVYGRYDSTYSGTLPQMQVVNGTECGVADATATMVGAADTWEQLSLNFTPTAKGIVTIRLVSNDTNGGGGAFFDDFAVA